MIVTLRHTRLFIAVVQKKNITNSECVTAALVTQHTKRMRRIVLLSAAHLAVLYFFLYYLINSTIFSRQHKIRILAFSTPSV
jgi:hypothetical protein